MAGTSSTITAVTVAAFRLGLIAATKASGATASTSNASRLAFAGMRDQHRDGAAIDRAADRSQHVVRVAFSDRPTLIWVTISEVSTAHSGNSRCSAVAIA